MSFQSYGEANIKNVQAVSEIPPTVMIGLGGTGKEILLRVRQLFFEKYGVPGLPITKYLWIDTDIRDVNIDGKSLDYIAEEVKFMEAEKVDCQIHGDEFTELQKRKNENLHIFNWFDARLARLGSVMNGARQIRQLGRLAFWHHAFKASDIRHKLGQAVEDVTDLNNKNVLQNQFGMNCTKEMRFILVFSVAGGTGSGMFLDTAFMIRREFAAMNPDIIGYLVLPSVFSPDPHNAQPIYANSFAALKELEYYSMRKDFSIDPGKISKIVNKNKGSDNKIISAHDFNANWDARGENLIAGPPFNTCYLIDNQTQAGGNISPQNKTDLCDMVADNIFIDYSSQGFSNKKRSVRSNLDEYLTKELEYLYKNTMGKVVHSELFSRRFSTFGLNKIYIPIERIRKACSYHLLTDLLALITRVNEPEVDIDVSVKKDYLPKLLLRVQAGADDFVSNLQKANDEGSSFVQFIDNQWINVERPKFLQMAANKANGMANRIEAQITGYRKAKMNKPRDPDEWGEFIKRIKRTNKKRFLQESKERIQRVVSTWIDNTHIGFDLAAEYLLALNRILEKDREFYERTARRFENQEKMLFDRVRSLQVLIGDEENGLWYHGWSIKSAVESLCRFTAQYFQQAVKAQIFTTAAEVCHELQVFIGTQEREEKNGEVKIIRKGLIQQIWGLKEDLLDIKANFDRKLHSFEQAESHAIFENLYSAEQLSDFYHLQSSDGKKIEIDTAQLQSIERQLLDHLHISTLYDLIEEKENIGIGNIIEKLETFAGSRFRNVQFDVDAILTFFHKYGKDQKRLKDKINHFVDYGKVWMRRGAIASVNSAVTKDYAEEIEIGINNAKAGHAYYKEFIKLVLNQVSASGYKGNLPSTVDVSKDAAYIYNEYAGLPLMYIGNLEDYKKAYVDEAINNRTLHIDRNDDQYIDIMIKSEQEVQDIIRVTKILFSGSILRVIDLDTDKENGDIESYIYQDLSSVIPTPRPLGSKQIAIEYLRGDPQLLREIESKIEAVQQKLTGVQMRKYFVILFYHHVAKDWAEGVEEGPFPPTYITIAGKPVEKFSPEYRAIAELVQEVSRELLANTGWKQKKINEYYIDQYKTAIDEYSEKIKVRDKFYRIFKKEELEKILDEL